MENYFYIKNQLLKTLLTAALLLVSTNIFAQVDVTATGGTSAASYTTLGAAFDAINAGTHTGTITLDISGNTSEGTRKDSLVASGTGSASYTTVLIQPTGGAARTISGAGTAGAAMIELQGADNVTINGLNTGGNTLTIENTMVSATSGTSTIRLLGDATNNLITNCNVNGSATMTNLTNGGTIFFSTAASGGTGNDNNTISFCNLGPAGINLPSKAIHSQGTTTAIANYNSEITVTNCNIYDYFQSNVHAGMVVNTGNLNWTISNNRFYQTGVRTATATTVAQGIQIVGGTAENMQITGNVFGFANSSGTGISAYVSGAGTVAFRVISLTLSTSGLPSSVQGNTIAGISLTSTIGAAATTSAAFAAIICSGGWVNIGNVTGNTIGSLTASNGISITTTSTATTTEVYGIYHGTSDSTEISNNNIGNITVGNSGTGSIKLYGIRTNSGVATVLNVISGNTIGSTSGPLVNTNAAATSLICGIQNNLARPVITNNTLRNFSIGAANTNTTTTASILGIYNSATAVNTNPDISGNTIHSLSNTHASAVVSVIGILNTGASPFTDPAVVSRNFIHSLSASSTAATVTGIYVIGGNANYQNNMVRLGSAMGVAAKINGINETGTGVNNYYFNTVYIGNTGIGSTVSNTFAYQNLSTGTGTRAIQNNIFINARSNTSGGGKHYAVTVAGTTPNPTGLTINYNIYRATGTGGVLGLYNSADVASLGAWQTAVGQDVNSLNSDPCLANPEGLPAVVDLHLTNCGGAGSPAESAGTAIGGITNDFDNQTRASLSPTDIGADAGLYGPAGKDVGITTLVRPTATSCHSAAEDVIVTLTNFSDPIDFSVDNVTVDVVITGVVSTSFNTVLTSGTLAPGASMNITMGQINTTVNGLYTFTSSSTMTGDINAGNNTLVSNITINYTPVSVTASASLSAICIGNSTILTASTLNGTVPYSYSWSPSGAITASTTQAPSSNTTYTVTVTDACGVTASATVSITVDIQAIATKTPGSRCGTGTVDLGATPAGIATLRWYTSAVGGAPVSTNTTYTTPVISTTTDFYVAARGPESNSVGARPAPATNTSSTGLFGLIFDAYQNFEIDTVEIYPASATGSITVELRNSSNVTLDSRTVAITGGSLTTAFKVPLNIAVYQGTGYRLVALSGPSMVREATLGGFPYSLGANGSITGSTSGTTYYWFYNWAMSQACESPRDTVTATVTPPPAVNLTVSPNDTVCQGQVVNLTAASPANDPYYAYSWSFDSVVTSVTGSSLSFTASFDTTVYLTAEDTTAASSNLGCRYVASVQFEVKDSAVTPIVSPSSASSCTPGSCFNLTVTNSTVQVPVVVDIGVSTTTLSTTGNPLRAGAGSLWEIRTQLLITAAELTAGGITPGNLTSLAFVTNSVGGVMDNFTLQMGHTSISNFTTTFETTPMTLVYSFPGTFTPAVGLNTYTFSTPFVWNGTSNIVINVCGRNSTTGTTAVQAGTPGFTGDLYAASLTGCSAATGATTATRPFMKIGGFTGIPATYNWNPGALTGSTVNVCPATTTTYTVVTTNSVGCTKSSTAVVNVSDVSYTSSTTVNITCNGGSDGSITVNATGTYTPLQYSINNGASFQSSNIFSGLAAGAYNVKVKDALNCTTAVQVVSLTEPSAITFTGTPVNATCYGASDGSITISNEAGGNGGPYTYSIDNGANYQASASFTGLAAGAYQVRIKDALGCESAATAVIVGTTPSTQYTITATSTAGGTISPAGSVNVDCGASKLFTMTPNSCYELDSVLVDGVNVGNAATYTFTNVLAAHTIDAYFSIIQYTITATYGVGGTISSAGVTIIDCNDNKTYTMTPDPGYIVDSVIVDGVNFGSVSNYTFNNVIANHTIYVSFSQCTDPATADAGPNAAVCAGQNHALLGSIGGTATAGTWSSSGTGTFTPSNDISDATHYIPSAADITAGSVVLTLTTDNPSGPCPAVSASMTLTINPLPVVSISGQLEICTLGSTTLTANASGTIISYQWTLNGTTPLGTNQSQSASAIGTYSVLVTNNNGCTNTASAVTSPVDTPVTTISGTSPICAGTSTTLTANVSLTNGTATAYLWSLNGTSTGVTTSTINASQTGSYTVLTTSSYGCTGISSPFVLSNATGPLSGLYTINTSLPVSCTNFHSFKDALTALNVNGVAGNVVVDVSAGHTETAPAGGLKIDMCALSPSLQSGSTQTVTFQKSGAGANPLITAQVGTGSLDGIVVLVGADYVTFNGIDLAEAGSNTTATTQAEWGYALLKCSGTDGCNNNTIKHCTVTLNKTNPNSEGIYVNNHTPASTVALTVTAVNGANSGNIFTDNTVTNCYSGIAIIGFNDVDPFSFYDQNNEIGQAGHGNNVSNIGGGATTALGIYTVYQNNLKVIDNIVNSTGTGVHTGSMYGIYTADASHANTDIIGNTVTVVHGASATGQQIAIINNSGSRLGRPTSSSVNNTVNIKNNIVQNCAYPGSNTFGAWIYTSRGGLDTMSAHHMIITGNQIINNTYSATVTGGVYGIISQALVDSASISNNTISGNTMNGAAAHTLRAIVTGYGGFSAGTVPYVYNLNVSGNTISNNVSTATTGLVDNIAFETYVGSSPQAGSKVTIRDNTVGNTTITAVSTAAYNCITTSGTLSTNSTIDMTGNTVTNINRNSSTTGAFNGIVISGAATAGVKLDSNVVSNISLTGATSGAFTAISNAGSASVTLNYSAVRNTVSGCSHAGTGTMGLLINGNAVNYTVTNNSILNNIKTSATTGVVNGLTVTGSTTTTISANVSSNTITGNNFGGTSAITLLDAGNALTTTIDQNNVSNNTKPGANGIMYCIRAAGGATSTVSYTNNTVNNNNALNTSSTGATTLYGIYNASTTVGTEIYDNNTVSNMAVGGTGTATTNTVNGINSTTGASSNKTISNNKISLLSTEDAISGTIYGIFTSTGATVNVFKNKVYDMQKGGASGTLNGIYINSGITVNAYNNYVGNLTTPFVNLAHGLIGIFINGGTTANIMFNTVRIGATASSGATFGSSGIYASTTPTVNLQNNIVINLATSTGATGATVAYRRSSATLTSYAATSDKNIFYAGAPSAINLIYGEGVVAPLNPQQTIAAYRTFVGPTRDANSQTENVSFISFTGSNAQFLHVNTGTPTLVESGASPISSPVVITDDYDGDIRNVSTPDIGADENNFTSAALVINSVTAAPGSQCSAVSHLITAVITPGISAVASATLNYAYNGTPQTAIAMVNTSGNNWTATIPSATPTNALVTYSVTASDASFTKVQAGISYKDNYLLTAATVATASPSTICANENVSLNVTSLAAVAGTVNIGTSTTTLSTTGNPLRAGAGASWQIRTQLIVRASELTASGLASGNITSLGFITNSVGGVMSNFSIDIGTTTSADFATTTFLTTPLTSVYSSPALFTPTVGLNTWTFSTPFFWDGTSNILINICGTNSTTGTTVVQASTPGYSGDLHTASLTGCTAATGGISATRPVIVLGGLVGTNYTSTFTWTWNPGALNGSSVVVSPGTTTTYTASGIDANGCTVTSNPVTITVNPLPSTPAANNSTQCGAAVPTCSVTGGGGIYSWYLTPTGGTAIAGEPLAALTTYSISNTTTFYVSENNGLCNSLRAEVIAVVNQPDSIGASASPSSVCLGQSLTLDATQFGSTNTYVYTWTANPSSGSGISGSASGSSVVITPTASGTYTYTVTAVDAVLGCTYINTVNVIVKALPLITSASASPSAICDGESATLTALTGLPAGSSFHEGYEAFPGVFVSGGTGTTWTQNSVYYQEDLNSAFATYTASSNGTFSMTTDVNLTGLTSPKLEFYHICATEALFDYGHVEYSTNGGSSWSPFPIANYLGTGVIESVDFPGVIHFDRSSYPAWAAQFTSSASTYPAGPATALWQHETINLAAYSGASTFRIRFRVTSDASVLYPGWAIDNVRITYAATSGSGTYNWVWNPGSLPGNVVVVTPTVSTVYTVTATDPLTTCTATATVSVTVNPLPAAPVATDGSHCGSGVPTCFVTGSGGIHNWYLTPTGGTPIPGEIGSVLTTYSVSTTTTFYVSEDDGICEGPRSMVIENVTIPDAVSASTSLDSICPGTTVNLSSLQTGSTNTYTYEWTANPTAGSGITGSSPGQSVFVTPTAGGTYTYTVTATDIGAGCVTSSQVVVHVLTPPLISSVTTSDDTICSGSSVTLEALTGTLVVDTVAMGTATTASTEVGINPLSPFWESNKVQYLIKASELTAQGLAAGNITGLAFKITAKGALTYDWLDYTVKMAHTSVTALTTTFETPAFQTVFGPTTIPAAAVVIGYNGIPLTPFNWDGSSNIIVDICFVNDPTGTCAACYNPSASLTFEYTATAYNSVNFDVIDNVGNCGATNTGTVSTNRPNFLIVGQSGATGPGTYSWLWNPGTLPGNNVVVTPMTTTTYTVTATDPLTTCTSTATITVNVNPTPAAPTANNSSQCGYAIPNCSVNGSGGLFNWYLVSSGGTPLAGESGSSLSSYAISSTTSFYVSETDGTCESARTLVIQTVTPADSVAIAAIPMSVCLGGSVDLIATQIGSNNSYVYSWTPSPVAGSGLSGTVQGSNLNITPTLSGTYTYNLVAFDAALTCTYINSVTVTVNALPSAPVPTANPSSICPGDSSQLNAGTFVNGNGTVSTPTLVGNSSSAAGFDVTNVSAFPITLHFLSFTSSATAGTALSESVYYNTTPMNCVFPTNVTTAPGWVLIGTAATTSAGTAPNLTLIPLDVNITIPPGLTYAFAFGGASVAYSNGAGGCPVIASDANISVKEGFGGTLTSTIATRAFNGSVSYSYQVGNPNLTYAWTPPATLSNAAIMNPKAGPVVTTTYTVTVTDPGTGCTASGTVDVNVLTSVGGTPIAATSVDTLCGPGTVNLSVTNPSIGLTYHWQQSTSGAVNTWSDIGTGVTQSYGMASDRYFRVYATCGSATDTSAVKFVFFANPTILGTTGGSRCGAGPVTLTVSGIGNFDWYDAPTGGNHVGTGASFTASYGVTTTVYAQANIGTCLYAGGRIPATAVVNASPTASMVVSPDSAVCEGTVLSFTASSSNANYVYSWSTDQTTVLGTGTSFVHTPASSTPYYLLASDTVAASPFFGCGYQVTKIVTVIPNPVTPIISPSNPTICHIGDSVTLTVTNADTTGATLYVWTPGNDTASSITVAPTATGYYAVTASNQSIVGTNVALSAVATSSGGGASPDYGPALLNDNNFGACDITGILQWGWVTTNGSYTFTWSQPQTFSSIIFFKANRPFTTIALIEYSNDGGTTWNPIIANYVSSVISCSSGDPFSLVDSVSFPAVTGNVLRLAGIAGSSNPNFREVQVLSGSAAGGCSVTDSVLVTYSPIADPVITPNGSTTLCPGGNVTLEASAGYTNYSWADGSGVVSTTASYNASPAVTTTYTVTVDNGGVCTATSTITVTITPLAPPTISSSNGSTFCSGGSTTLDAGTYDAWLWSTSATTQSISVNSSGTYTVTVTGSGGCTSVNSIVITVNPSPPTAIVSPTGPINICDNGSDSPITLTSDITGAGAGSSISWNDIGSGTADTLAVDNNSLDLLINGGTYAYGFTVTNSYGCQANSNLVTVNIVPCASAVTLNAKMYLEGYYAASNTGLMDNYGSGGCLFLNGYGSPNDVDTVEISMMDASTYALVDAQKGILQVDGTVSVTFGPAVTAGTAYYIRVKHRSAVQTWSANPVMTSAVTVYDFSTAQTQAYGNNMVLSQDALHWTFYSGDISDAGSAMVGLQDEVIESQDYSDMENAVFITLTGYVSEDITGDVVVESLDYSIMENNVFFVIFSVHP